MRAWKILCFLIICSLVLVAPTMTAAAEGRDLGRETLAPNDGWASYGAGTTGGAAATPDQVYVVTNRQELVAALNNGVYGPGTNPSNLPKIIYVSGVIDANVDDNNQALTCEDYYRNGYTPEAFQAPTTRRSGAALPRADRSKPPGWPRVMPNRPAYASESAPTRRLWGSVNTQPSAARGSIYADLPPRTAAM